jgi:tRNA (guanosine-2'-O-)-methyltransferase
MPKNKVTPQQAELNVLTTITEEIEEKHKTNRRIRADFATQHRLNTFICVIENPALLVNVGGIIRSANALGAGKVYVIDGFNIMPKTWAEMKNNNYLKTITVSAIKWTYIKRFNTTQECLNYLKQNNFTSVATSPHNKNGTESVELKNCTFTDKKLAIWFGNESHGISDEAVGSSDRCVKINMFGMIESLNLSTCASIMMNEIANQRREFKKKINNK